MASLTVKDKTIIKNSKYYHTKSMAENNHSKDSNNKQPLTIEAQKSLNKIKGSGSKAISTIKKYLEKDRKQEHGMLELRVTNFIF